MLVLGLLLLFRTQAHGSSSLTVLKGELWSSSAPNTSSYTRFQKKELEKQSGARRGYQPPETQV